MDIQEFVLEGIDWIYMAQERDKWRALAQSVISVVLEINYELKI
jgi:hypothetical protein